MGQETEEIGLPQPSRQAACCCGSVQQARLKWMARSWRSVVLLVRSRSASLEALKPGAIGSRCPWPAQPLIVATVHIGLSWSASMPCCSSGREAGARRAGLTKLVGQALHQRSEVEQVGHQASLQAAGRLGLAGAVEGKRRGA